ncbi:MAG: NAD(P)H-binding protein [Fermentimonas sp.]|nr:NAD(P)H-binding protein [Fermentimonas sp.]
MKALLIGATGATGSDLLQLLLDDSEVESVDIFVRRDPGMEHSKINVHIIDFEKYEEWKHLVDGDVLFSCLGTTLKDAGSKEAQWKVDYEYQYQFAKAARENGVGCYVLVSAMNASSKSKIFYSRMKGKLDEDVNKLGFPKLLIFKPPSLIRKGSSRKMEKMGVKVINFFNRLGLLKSMKTMSTYTLAKDMLDAVKLSVKA